MPPKKEEEKPSADGKYYRCTGGLTVGMIVAQEGEILEGEAFGEGFVPLTEDEQKKKFGRILYTEVDPDDDMLTVIHEESVRVRAMGGMQHPDMPPVDTSKSVVAEPNLQIMSRSELRAKAKTLGLNFPADTGRDQMIGAIEKKQSAEGEDDEEEEVVTKRRARAKKVIEAANTNETVDEEDKEEEEE